MNLNVHSSPQLNMVPALLCVKLDLKFHKPNFLVLQRLPLSLPPSSFACLFRIQCD